MLTVFFIFLILLPAILWIIRIFFIDRDGPIVTPVKHSLAVWAFVTSVLLFDAVTDTSALGMTYYAENVLKNWTSITQYLALFAVSNLLAAIILGKLYKEIDGPFFCIMIAGIGAFIILAYKIIVWVLTLAQTFASFFG